MTRLDLSDGGHLEYELAGDGPTVTLIHPGLWDMRTWDREFARFPEAGYRVLRYDVRGYGKSSRLEPGQPYSHVRDLLELIDATEVAQTAIVGCSMGGGIELDFALEHPGARLGPRAGRVGPRRVREHGGRGRVVDRSGTSRSRPRSRPVTSSRRRISGSRSGRRSGHRTSGARGSARSRSTTSTRSRWTRAEKSELDPPAAHRLAEIDVPTLILEAEHDPPEMRRHRGLPRPWRSWGRERSWSRARTTW